ncbi:MAG: FG-GAP-like repeat-containing protein [Candidatus Latescibacterota bacterium]
MARHGLSVALAIASGALLGGPGGAQTVFSNVVGEGGCQSWGAEGMAVGDFNNDGWPDLAIAQGTAGGGRLVLLENLGQSRFADRTSAIRGPLSAEPKSGGLCFADYDNDGDLDLFVPVGRLAAGGSDMLLRNDRGVFVDVAPQAGVGTALPSYGATWLDHDRDGHLDLYVGHWAGSPSDPAARNQLYHSRGDGTFKDFTQNTGLGWPLAAAGGSMGALAAGDFDDDGWPDLYIAGFGGPGHLLLNGDGRFHDATGGDMAHPSGAAGAAVGDIDNNGSLDLFQAGGAAPQVGETLRSPLFVNLGGADFVEIAEGYGLTAYSGTPAAGAALADFDNDGDLDLVTATPALLHLNQGDGIFAASTTASGIAEAGGRTLTVGDWDLDGSLDVALGGDPMLAAGDAAGGLYLNTGSPHHYLQVEVAGVRSNRTGIGARVIATAGGLQQWREITSSTGPHQHEMVAHLGLGEHTRVERLEVRWPSGGTDVLEDVPADQRLRVLEGQQGYQRVEPAVWTIPPPDSLVAGTLFRGTVAVRPALFEAGARIERVVAEMGAAGGPEGVALDDAGDGTWRLEAALRAPADPGYRTVAVTIDQSTALGPRWTRLSREVLVLPAADLVVFGDALAPGWRAQAGGSLAGLDVAAGDAAYDGQKGISWRAPAGAGEWEALFEAPTGVPSVGYRVLRFACRREEGAGPAPGGRLSVELSPGRAVDLVKDGHVDLGQAAWQVVEVPLALFELGGAPIAAIRLAGDLGGAIYLDEVRLVAARPSWLPSTAVAETRGPAVPRGFALLPNYPNPFNAETVIPFTLPRAGVVELAVYDLAGQPVARLVDGLLPAGRHTARWDGRDGGGRRVASAVYLCQLRAGANRETRKLLLLE